MNDLSRKKSVPRLQIISDEKQTKNKKINSDMNLIQFMSNNESDELCLCVCGNVEIEITAAAAAATTTTTKTDSETTIEFNCVLF